MLPNSTSIHAPIISLSVPADSGGASLVFMAGQRQVISRISKGSQIKPSLYEQRILSSDFRMLLTESTFRTFTVDLHYTSTYSSQLGELPMTTVHRFSRPSLI